MKWLGYKQVKVSSLRFDIPDIKRRAKTADVADLADTIRRNGEELIHAPTVRAESMVLVCGRDRMAALAMLKAKRLWVHIVDCTDDEAAELEKIENLYRRPIPGRAEMIAELVQRRVAKMQDAEAGTVSPLADQTIKAKARKEVARAAGISPASVKKAEQRAAAAKEPQQDSAPVEAPASPAIDLLGVDEPHARYAADHAAVDQSLIDRAAKLLQQAQAALAGATACTSHQEVKADLQRVAGRVRALRPHSLCPWCKGLPPEVLGAPCAPCDALGYVPEEKRDRAPAELRGERGGPQPLVAIDGKFYPFADVRDGKAPPKNGHAKKVKRIRVEDEKGNEIPVGMDDVPPLDLDEAY